MNSIMAALGITLMFASIGILAWVASGMLNQNSAGSVASEGLPALEKAVRDHLHRGQLQNQKRIFLFGGVLLLVSSFLILFSYGSPSPPIVVRTGTRSEAPNSADTPYGRNVTREGGTDTRPNIPFPAQGLPDSVWHDPYFYLISFGIAGLFGLGIAVLLLGRSIGARAAGATMLVAATTTSQLHLIKEFKFFPDFKGSIFGSAADDEVGKVVDDRLAKIKTDILDELGGSIDSSIKFALDARIPQLKADLNADLKADLKADVKAELKAAINAYFRGAGVVGPEHIGDFVGFDLGQNEITPSVTGSIPTVCSKWDEHNHDRKALLLVVGATDRVPLGASARARYESNVGLARARAEEIKKGIAETCHVPSEQILAIVSGPQTTPKQEDEQPPYQGHTKDRMVGVWALWSWGGPDKDAK